MAFAHSVVSVFNIAVFVKNIIMIVQVIKHGRENEKIEIAFACCVVFACHFEVRDEVISSGSSTS